MLKRTLTTQMHGAHWCRVSGGMPTYVVPPKKYVRHMPRNPWFGCKHDGTTTDYCQGFEAQDIHHLYRYRHNVLPIGQSLGKGGPNPPGKMVHYLEVTEWAKFTVHAYGEEGLPHTILFGLIMLIIFVHLSRYWIFHPDITSHGIALWMTRPLLTKFRYNYHHTYDMPVFRFFQRPCEFYGYDMYREQVKLGIQANDPWIEYVKSIGKEKDLHQYVHDGHVGLYPPAKPKASH